jgi:hypothetical protein
MQACSIFDNAGNISKSTGFIAQGCSGQQSSEVAMNETRKAYEEKLDGQLKEWSAQIALLQAKANNAKADAKIEYQRTVEMVQRKQHDAKAKLHELKSAGDEAWEDLKTGAENAWDDVKTAYHDATARFK